jgi:hypothetical protein
VILVQTGVTCAVIQGECEDNVALHSVGW